jgi:glycine dehydrogenase subunit 1
MDVANASMYDGSTSVPEAAMMASRITGRDRVLVSRAVHPEYREVLETYAANQELKVEEFGYDATTGSSEIEDLARRLDSTTAAVIVQSPNFFGMVEDLKPCAALAHSSGALLVHIFTEAVSLGLLEPCANSDIVAGELQSFAIAPSYGGPYAGGSCPAAWPARHATRAAIAPTVSHFQPASSTSGARRPLRTFAPTRRSSR